MMAARGVLTRYLESIEVKIFLVSIVLHLLIQLSLNAILPFSSYSELSGHDGSLYYAISSDPFPNAPSFTLKRYQRPLLPLLVWALFSWNRHLGFSVVNIVVGAISTVYFYKIMGGGQAATALRLTLLYSVIPYLFASVHLGLAEPLMMAGLLAGYYYARRGDRCKAASGYAIALLAKEVALFPVLAEIVLEIRRAGLRHGLRLAVSFVPMAGWYLLLALRWKQPFWILHGPEGQLGFGPAAMADLILNLDSVTGRLPAAFIVLNQIANGLLLALIIVGLYQLRSSLPIVVWAAFSAAPLLFLGRPIYGNNFDLGRQALPASLLFITLRRSRLVLDQKCYWLGVGGLLGGSLFWTLYFAKFFVYW